MSISKSELSEDLKTMLKNVEQYLSTADMSSVRVIKKDGEAVGFCFEYIHENLDTQENPIQRTNPELPGDPKTVLENIKQYLLTADVSSVRSIKKDGKVVGFWQTGNWYDGLFDLAEECERVIDEIENS